MTNWEKWEVNSLSEKKKVLWKHHTGKANLEWEGDDGGSLHEEVKLKPEEVQELTGKGLSREEEQAHDAGETICAKVDHVARGARQVCQTQEMPRRSLGKRGGDGK